MRQILLVLSIAMVTGCGKPVDVITAVQADVVASGWLPAGVVAGQNKIVPSISVTLKNVSAETLNALQVNAVFRRAAVKEEIGSDFHPVAGSGGLPAGGQTPKIVLKAQRGYTGIDSYDELLRNSHFVDGTVELFVKAGSGQWTRIGEYPIARELTGEY
jgi:hypothetical protein